MQPASIFHFQFQRSPRSPSQHVPRLLTHSKWDFEFVLIQLQEPFPRRALQPRNAKKLLNFEAFPHSNFYIGVVAGILSPRLQTTSARARMVVFVRNHREPCRHLWLLTRVELCVYLWDDLWRHGDQELGRMAVLRIK
ncbi:hypothetical protein AVEN_39373-1 [Araneus ventricosus]|uniref:Uncharacterized protein n=1 Tax=Araneus ventricosus TaxID=182803 RepID=A0A4Y2RPE0_ARAVE|nr:hypothetical protein AVEN_39373-1 [Araneus ventricosus]